MSETDNLSQERLTLSTQEATQMPGVSPRTTQLWVENSTLRAWSTLPILLVNDAPPILERYKIHIKEWEIETQLYFARNGFKGLVNLGRHNPKIVITDLVMPDMDGLEMIRNIRAIEALNSLKIIAIPSLSEERLAIEDDIPDEIDICQKPLISNQLVTATLAGNRYLTH